VAVVAAPREEDLRPPGGGARDLDGEVDGLAAGDAEDDARDVPREELDQAPGERAAVSAEEVVVADVERAERVAEGGGDLRMTVAQVEDAAVAVGVEERDAAVDVVEVAPLPLPHDEVHAGAEEEADPPGFTWRLLSRRARRFSSL